MERYDYFWNVKEDVKTWIDDHKDEVLEMLEEVGSDELASMVEEECFCDDCVTGNASGSYTFNSWQAEEYVCHNLDLLGEAIEEFCSDMDLLKSGAEACDVTIRCYVLGQVVQDAIDETNWLQEEIERMEEDA